MDLSRMNAASATLSNEEAITKEVHAIDAQYSTDPNDPKGVFQWFKDKVFESLENPVDWIFETVKGVKSWKKVKTNRDPMNESHVKAYTTDADLSAIFQYTRTFMKNGEQVTDWESPNKKAAALHNLIKARKFISEQMKKNGNEEALCYFLTLSPDEDMKAYQNIFALETGVEFHEGRMNRAGKKTGSQGWKYNPNNNFRMTNMIDDATRLARAYRESHGEHSEEITATQTQTTAELNPTQQSEEDILAEAVQLIKDKRSAAGQLERPAPLTEGQHEHRNAAEKDRSFRRKALAGRYENVFHGLDEVTNGNQYEALKSELYQIAEDMKIRTIDSSLPFTFDEIEKYDLKVEKTCGEIDRLFDEAAGEDIAKRSSDMAEIHPARQG